MSSSPSASGSTTLAPAAALERLDALDQPRLLAGGDDGVLLGHGLAAGGAAVFFGGTLSDALLSFALGPLVLEDLHDVVTCHQAPWRQAGRRAVVAAGTERPLPRWPRRDPGGRINDGVVALASIIVLVPGLSRRRRRVPGTRDPAVWSLGDGPARRRRQGFLTIG